MPDPQTPLIPAAGLDQDLDVLVLGQAALGIALDGAETARTRLAGAGARLAVALARAGRRVGLAAPVAEDAPGRAVLRLLAEEGVSVLAPPRRGPSARTAVEVSDPAGTTPPRPGTADQLLRPEEITGHLVRAPVTVVTGATLAADPARGAAFEALDRAQRSVLLVETEPAAWDDPAILPETLAYACATAQIIAGTEAGFAAMAPDGLSEAARLARSARAVLCLCPDRLIAHGPAGPITLRVPGPADIAGITARMIHRMMAGADLAGALDPAVPAA